MPIAIDFEARKQAKIIENEPMIRSVKDAIGDERETTTQALMQKLNFDMQDRAAIVRLGHCMKLIGWKKFATRINSQTRYVWRRVD